MPPRQRPVEMHQLCATVLIAAIPLPVIRADGMTPSGACREWPKPKPADDRRGVERVRRDVRPSREEVRTASAQFRRSTRVAAADAVRPPIHRPQPAGTDCGASGPSGCRPVISNVRRRRHSVVKSALDWLEAGGWRLDVVPSTPRGTQHQAPGTCGAEPFK